MNYLKNITLLFLLVILFQCNRQEPVEELSDNELEGTTMVYDSMLAQKLGADDYGMSQYVMAFLLTGDSVNIDSTRRTELSKGHMANIGRMAEAGDLILAGPFLDGGKLRGIYIFDVTTVEEAEALTKTDPAVQAGVFKFEMHPWYGSAALKEVNEIGERIRKVRP